MALPFLELKIAGTCQAIVRFSTSCHLEIHLNVLQATPSRPLYPGYSIGLPIIEYSVRCHLLAFTVK